MKKKTVIKREVVKTNITRAKTLADRRIAEIHGAMCELGLGPAEELIVDDGFHSGRLDERDTKKSGRYRVSTSLNGSAYFKNRRTGVEYRWNGTSFAKIRRSTTVTKRKLRNVTPKVPAIPSKLFNAWLSAGPASIDHPYLVDKEIEPHSARQMKNFLGIPLTDVQGIICNFHQIGPDGTKRNLLGYPIQGAYCLLGGPIVDVVLMCEGFATAASVHEALGLPTVASVGTANLATSALALRGIHPRARFYFCADNDFELEKRTGVNPGKDAAFSAAKLVSGSVILVQFDDVKNPNGMSDFNDLAQRLGSDAVKAQIEAHLVPPQQLVVLTSDELIAREFPPREFMLGHWLYTQSINMVFAWRGVGKTWFMLFLAYAVASGSPFLRWVARKPQSVLYVDGEMPGHSLRDRVRKIEEFFAVKPPEGYLRFVTPDVQAAGIEDLGTPEGQALLDNVAGNAKLIILDNLSSLVRGTERENDAESWRVMSPWLLRHRAEQRSVIYVHHSNKQFGQRGTSKKEDLADISIKLDHQVAKNHNDGAQFIIHFDKARDVRGEDKKDFEARLITDSDGKLQWIVTDVVRDIDEIEERRNAGQSTRQISRDTGIPLTTVHRRVKELEDQGRIERESEGSWQREKPKKLANKR